MTERQIARKKAIIRRRIFLSVCAAVLVAVIALTVFIVNTVISAPEDKDSQSKLNSSDVSEVSESSSDIVSSGEPEQIIDSIENEKNEYGLDVNFSNLLLVNGQNPLPENYDTEVREYLVEIDAQYRNNNYVTQIHRDVYPYITAMVAEAQRQGVDLRVWSPFRSYAIQKDLFQKSLLIPTS